RPALFTSGGKCRNEVCTGAECPRIFVPDDQARPILALHPLERVAEHVHHSPAERAHLAAELQERDTVADVQNRGIFALLQDSAAPTNLRELDRPLDLGNVHGSAVEAKEGPVAVLPIEAPPREAEQ